MRGGLCEMHIALGRFFAQQHSFNANIFIQIVPVDALARATDLKVSAPGWRAMGEARIPTDGN